MKTSIVERLLAEGSITSAGGQADRMAEVFKVLPSFLRSVQENAEKLEDIISVLSAYGSHPDKIVTLFHPRNERIDTLKDALSDLEIDGQVAGKYMDILEQFESKAVVGARIPESK